MKNLYEERRTRPLTYMSILLLFEVLNRISSGLRFSCVAAGHRGKGSLCRRGSASQQGLQAVRGVHPKQTQLARRQKVALTPEEAAGSS